MLKNNPKKHIQLVMPLELFYKWQINRNLQEGMFTARLIKLVQADTNLNDSEKKVLELESIKKDLSEKITGLEMQVASVNLMIEQAKEREKEEIQKSRTFAPRRTRYEI